MEPELFVSAGALPPAPDFNEVSAPEPSPALALDSAPAKASTVPVSKNFFYVKIKCFFVLKK